MKIEIGDLVMCRKTGLAWHVDQFDETTTVLRRGKFARLEMGTPYFLQSFLPVHKEQVVMGPEQISELDAFELRALRNLRDVVRDEIRARDKSTGFFDESKAWIYFKNALSAC